MMYPVQYAKFAGIKWRVITEAEELVAGEPVVAVGPLDLPLPVTLEVGTSFTVHAKGDQCRIMSGDHVITGVGAGNNLAIPASQTATLVVSAAGALEVI